MSSQLNTSTIFQDIIKTTSSSSNSRRDLSDILPTPLPSQPRFDARGLIVARADDPLSRASSFFNSIRTSILPQPTGAIAGGFSSLANQALSQIAKIFGESINDALNSLISEIVDEVGIREWYGLYFGVLCSADYKPNFRDPDATLANISCSSLRGLSSIHFFDAGSQ